MTPEHCVDCGVLTNPEQNKYNGTSVWKKGYFAPKVGPEQNKWEQDLRFLMDGLFVPPKHAGSPPVIDWEHWHSKESYEDIYSKIRDFVSQIRQETIEKIKEFIVAEINIARTEGDKTSRLTSLYMRITELKD